MTLATPITGIASRAPRKPASSTPTSRPTSTASALSSTVLDSTMAMATAMLRSGTHSSLSVAWAYPGSVQAIRASRRASRLV
jgi:hypothetical protein